MKWWSLPLLSLLLQGCFGCRGSGGEDRYIDTLKEAGAESDEFWVRVHAIEFLIGLGYTEEAGKLSAACRQFEETPQKRIGYWRMKHRISDPGEKPFWLQKIKDAYLDTAGTDRVHAAETLAKLSFSLKQLDSAVTGRDLSAGGAISAFVGWGMALPVDPADEPDFEALIGAVEDTSSLNRRVASYAIGFLKPLPEEYCARLIKATESEPENSEAYPYLVQAAFIQKPAGSRNDAISQKLYRMADSGDKSALIALCNALAAAPEAGAEPLLRRIFNLEKPVPEADNIPEGTIGPANQDVKIAAAFALEQIRIKK